MRIRLMLWAALALALLTATGAQADYSLSRSVFGNGGGDIWGGGYLHQATVGQAAIGLVSGVVYEHGAGFWYAPAGGGSGVAGPAGELPRDFAFSIESGNPVPGAATIRFALPITSRVRIDLFDVTGRGARTIVERDLPAGVHVTQLGSDGLPAGVYFCRMKVPAWSEVQRIVLLR